jgi:hypothetical protein
MFPVVVTWLLAYVLTGASIVIGVRLIWLACDHLPLWTLAAAVLCVVGVLVYAGVLGNVLVVVGLLTTTLAAALLTLLVWVPRVLPGVVDAVTGWHRRGEARRADARTR